ncbi:MAG: hypothetical protein HYT62_03075 [Candidatus Yanofskybacteria bacterium]|nr:hypothetical protein [Candidatus Yanofskybacteria bacterium]
MKNWLVGTGVVISGGFLVVLLMALGVSRQISFGIGVPFIVGGYIIQMYAAFSMKAFYERQDRLAQREYEALMERVQKLPPEQAIQLLLDNINDNIK